MGDYPVFYSDCSLRDVRGGEESAAPSASNWNLPKVQHVVRKHCSFFGQRTVRIILKGFVEKYVFRMNLLNAMLFGDVIKSLDSLAAICLV